MAWRTRLRNTVSTAAGVIVVLVAMAAASVLVPAMRSRSDVRSEVEELGARTPGKPADATFVVTLDSDAQTKGGIATAAATPAVFQARVRVYGTVLPLDRIVTLYNASLTSMAQLQAARAKQAASRSANARAQALLEAFSTAKAQAQTAAATVEIDTAAVATQTTQIEALRNTALQEWGPVLGGAIVARAPLAADLVQQRSRLLQVALQPGAVAGAPEHLSFALTDGTRVTGRLVSEAAQIDPKVQNVGYLYVAPLVPGLVPGIGVVADLPRGEAQAGFDVPPSAVVWQAGKPWIYVRTAPDRFERRAIAATATPTAGGGYVLPGTHPAGAKMTLVVTGAQVLLSQEMRSQIPSDGDD